MLGAIIGDIVGSTREWHNIKTVDFDLIPAGSRFTDDTVMTLAVAEWLMKDQGHQPETLVECMQALGRKYFNAGYGGMFRKWLMSDNPQPYRSFGNGSAMRVSPVGLYANSFEEALDLARISASVTHNHPEGIKGAQAIAACIYMRRNGNFSNHRIKQYIEQHFGYNLCRNLEDIRPEYGFDATCQGSVPIAIMASLQQSDNAEKALRLAISMGGDSDTIGCMTAAIATTLPPYTKSGSSLSDETIEKCRQLLPADLLDINDRFEEFIDRPLWQSYKVYNNGGLYAGEYPGDKAGERAEQKIRQMIHFGIKHFVDLTEEGELKPYSHLLPKGCTYLRFPIRDVCAPESVESVHQLLHRISELRSQGGHVYLHCWGGVGRTGTIVACHVAMEQDNPTLESVLTALRNHFKAMPKSAHRVTPESKEQIDFIARFIEDIMAHKKEQKRRISDCIRGSLMAGAAGDALGYTVEFMGRTHILSKYGEGGITLFELAPHGKALISDDTQMTLFTANGILTGITRGCMRDIGGRPENYVDGAYLDWYYTQSGRKRDVHNDWHHTWLRDLPELAHRRAPGATCMNACESLLQGKTVQNYSKGCGGIMRVAPIALLEAGYEERKENHSSLADMAKAGAETARVTHKHPLGFLPAAQLTHLLYKLVPLSAEEAKSRIAEIAEETVATLHEIYKGKFVKEKHLLADLTRRAVSLAQSDIEDVQAIRLLGEGWTGEEAWAIALYCAIRHTDSMTEAIIAAVNHDGDSDSTGSICGNIMGAIYGYEEIKRQRLFCPYDKTFEETLELHDIILALADDLYTSCIISKCSPIDTLEQRQWYERYCEMKPTGI